MGELHNLRNTSLSGPSCGQRHVASVVPMEYRYMRGNRYLRERDVRTRACQSLSMTEELTWGATERRVRRQRRGPILQPKHQQRCSDRNGWGNYRRVTTGFLYIRTRPARDTEDLCRVQNGRSHPVYGSSGRASREVEGRKDRKYTPVPVPSRLCRREKICALSDETTFWERRSS